ncbi:MAG: cellulase [Aliidiomarina sp.]|uniref:cellulose synthase complex periplasmic endoglucanase BcsZ n=1 Tax=Aliidiomarina sp. TaxID=1872439 RepID=UPI0025B9E827|nr:cellulose synthase complex periplasmic endoglucanase BcsZ [Aliidiomarina sp.]MCH8500423.1 cellulase [Aliidiomarina sp.]
MNRQPTMLVLMTIFVVLLSSCNRSDQADVLSRDVFPPLELGVTERLSFQWHYQRFIEQFISADGRVIDLGSERSITTSEGQSYGLWFSLLADDQETFTALLKWTVNNLADGDIRKNLPAWLWGQREDESWGVIDANSASDSDIWIAYALLAAAELWQNASYQELGEELAKLILAQETVALNGERLLLPAPVGFQHHDQSTMQDYWIVNPSYLTITLFHGLAAYTQDERWHEVIRWSERLFSELASESHRMIPNWVAVDSNGRLLALEQTAQEHQQQVSVGSYDAIRTYLWLSWDFQQGYHHYLSKFDAFYTATAATDHPPTELEHQGDFRGQGPVGFSAVALLYFHLHDTNFRDQAEFEERVYTTQLARLAARSPARYAQRYYDTMLVLFGLSALECVAFTADGKLNVTSSCNRERSS